jgi:hypothetical protein
MRGVPWNYAAMRSNLAASVRQITGSPLGITVPHLWKEPGTQMLNVYLDRDSVHESCDIASHRHRAERRPQSLAHGPVGQ